MICIAYQPTKISIAKEVMPAKRETKILSTKKRVVIVMRSMDVDNVPNSTENFKMKNLRCPGRL